MSSSQTSQTLWQNIYRQLAQNIDNSIADPPDAVNYLYNNILVIINITGSTEGNIISTEFLDLINKLYLHSLHTAFIEQHIKKVIKKINNFTIRNYGDLTIFINGIAYWDDGCIPYYWTQYSEELGYDTSGWNICS